MMMSHKGERYRREVRFVSLPSMQVIVMMMMMMTMEGNTDRMLN